jgi:hypothetical protein
MRWDLVLLVLAAYRLIAPAKSCQVLGTYFFVLEDRNSILYDIRTS